MEVVGGVVGVVVVGDDGEDGFWGEWVSFLVFSVIGGEARFDFVVVYACGDGDAFAVFDDGRCGDSVVVVCVAHEDRDAGDFW